MYTVLKFLHVLSVIAWIGGVFTLLLLNRLFAKAGEPSAMRTLGQQGGALSMRVFMPSMLTALITGIGLVQVGNLSFHSLWIVWGMAAVVVAFLLGGVIAGGTARKLGKQLAAGEIDPARAAVVQRRLVWFAMLNLLV